MCGRLQQRRTEGRPAGQTIAIPGDCGANSVSHTDVGQHSGWDANLAATAKASSVEVYHRADPSAERLTDYWVMVSDRPFTAVLSPTAQAAQSGV